MTTFTTHLKIPHLDQNVAQPEIPENEAKDILDAATSGILNITMIADTAYTLDDTSLTYPQEWQHAIFVIDAITHTADTDLIIPVGKKMKFTVHSKIGVAFNIKVTYAAGGGFVNVPDDGIYQMYCDGTDVWRIL